MGSESPQYQKKRAQDSSLEANCHTADMGKNTQVCFSNREHPICGSSVKMATQTKGKT